MKATAIANANIALVKYWGKRDKKLMLPNNGSISLTLGDLNTHTTVEFDPKYEKDVFILNGEELESASTLDHLDVIREMAGIKDKAKIVSKGNFPVAAGLASSASGLAALSVAGAKAAGLNLDKKELSILSRRGSGSASRSVEGGFVEWIKGEKEDGSDSFGVQIADENFWKEFRIVTVITSTKEKKVKSRAGMSQTVATCPYYDGWLKTVNEDLDKVREGIKEKNFTKVGETAEYNCLKMHATMMTTKPPIIYWNDVTMRVIHSVMDWREEGLESYFTIDAGPQVKIMCLEKDVKEIGKRLSKIKGIEKVLVCKPGGEARLVDDHLF
ncbi:MAG: diphosphomevalonate decarboxylase [Candidatus Aenigmatarchaeota archaeon]